MDLEEFQKSPGLLRTSIHFSRSTRIQTVPERSCNALAGVFARSKQEARHQGTIVLVISLPCTRSRFRVVLGRPKRNSIGRTWGFRSSAVADKTFTSRWYDVMRIIGVRTILVGMKRVRVLSRGNRVEVRLRSAVGSMIGKWRWWIFVVVNVKV